MAKAKYKAEQIIPMLREAEVEIGKGKTVREVCRKLGIMENTYHSWRRQYGGLKLDQAKRQPKRRRLWDNDGSCIRLRPAHARFMAGGSTIELANKIDSTIHLKL